MEADLAACAATYAYHLTRAHAFVDGNKRIAAAVAETFLESNGTQLAMTDKEIVALFLDIAAGLLSRDEVEQLIRTKIKTDSLTK
jgi:death on curing protein